MIFVNNLLPFVYLANTITVESLFEVHNNREDSFKSISIKEQLETSMRKYILVLLRIILKCVINT